MSIIRELSRKSLWVFTIKANLTDLTEMQTNFCPAFEYVGRWNKSLQRNLWFVSVPSSRTPECKKMVPV